MSEMSEWHWHLRFTWPPFLPGAETIHFQAREAWTTALAVVEDAFERECESAPSPAAKAIVTVNFDPLRDLVRERIAERSDEGCDQVTVELLDDRAMTFEIEECDNDECAEFPHLWVHPWGVRVQA